MTDRIAGYRGAMNMSAERVVEIAESWLGTPYRHQGSRKHVGCDCLGLVRGVWRELYGTLPERPGPYAIDWAVHDCDERLLEAARRWLVEVDGLEVQAGSMLLFRWRDRLPASHCGIVDGSGRLIHAYEGSRVVRSAMPDAWRRRIAGVFQFPQDGSGSMPDFGMP